ncbi:MAG TPA: efflux RND transporter periplasmic adaptor subunit [Candidatus Polarisedimenticolaceae bacterium]|nr:efflux RND transporter periplasmic adaptor subunit [Candidatus Polarisedimenticolaceae bacterium]
MALGVAVVVALAAVSLAVSRLGPASPKVERSAVLIETVRRGEMLREVRGPGTLVAEDIRWIPAATEGRVDRILGHPGDRVAPDTVILELSNPELERVVLDATWEVKAAEADLQRDRKQLQSQLLNEKAAAATVQSEFHQAQMEAELQEKLAKDGLTSDLDLKRARLRATEQGTRQTLEQERLLVAAEAGDAQLAAQRARLEQLRALLALRRDQLDGLRVRAGTSGVLQQVPVEVGQSVAPGTNLARVAQPGRLKAQLQIAETQVPAVSLGQIARIDTRAGVVEGRVARIDPGSRNGSVTVDVSLSGELPHGARPDMTVDGTIELERLPSVLFVGQPTGVREGTEMSLFRLAPSGDEAERVPVRVGRVSATTVEIVSGLKEGDRVVVSDTSAWEKSPKIRLE